MATLYELSSCARDLYALLQADEIDEQTVADTMESMGAEEKLVSYCQVLNQLKADSEMFGNEARRIAARKKSTEDNIERMKKAMHDYLVACNKEKDKAGTFDIRITKSASAEIYDPTSVPVEYVVPAEPKFDKVTIRKKLLAGEEIAGAKLVYSEGVAIR